jgi:glycosyltransferase involved in cell wall biosynthesis
MTVIDYSRDVISVVIPSYNSGRFLREAIDSVLAQTYPHYTIVVVDDGSADETARIASSYPSVFYVRQDHQGLPTARNTGLQASEGKYVVFLDADDRLLPTHFETSVQAFRERPEAAFVCGAYRKFGLTVNEEVHHCDPLPDHYGSVLRSQFIGPPLHVMFKRDIVNCVGRFRPELRSCEDFDLFLRITRLFPIFCHHTLVAEYRLHEGQMTRLWHHSLMYSMKVFHSQRVYVRQHPQYRDAYETGVAHFRQAWGERLLWQTIALARAGGWARALKFFWVLLRYYPQGLRRVVLQKTARVVSGHHG